MSGYNTNLKKWSRKSVKFFLLLFLIGIGAVFLFPFYWMVITSLRPLSEFYVMPIPLLPKQLSFENYQLLFSKTDFARGLLNSFFISTVAVFSQVIISALAGYTFACLRFRWRETLFLFVLATMTIPTGVRMIPSYMMMARIQWIDTYLPLLVPTIANALGIFWMRQYCRSVPLEILDAARVDGAGEFRIFWEVVMPNIKPAMVSLGVFVFMTNWNDFISPLIFLRSQEIYTVQLWLSVVSRLSIYTFPHIVMAGSVLSSLVTIFLFAVSQKYFTTGLFTPNLKR